MLRKNYGYLVRPHMVRQHLISQLRVERPLKIWGDASQHRDATWGELQPISRHIQHSTCVYIQYIYYIY